MLHVLACMLHLRPCESQAHEVRLCYHDCLEILTTCVDWTQVTKPHTAESVCSKSSAVSIDPCISTKYFLKDIIILKPALSSDEEIEMPCKKNPCPSDHICFSILNAATNYRCRPACTLGKMSKQLIAVGSWVQIPRYKQQGCNKVCQCTVKGIEKCKILSCFAFKSCWIQDRLISHNTIFFLECKTCRCFMGELTCFKKHCGVNRKPVLPCNCPAHYFPVCSRLGVTYASPCLAKCARFMNNEIEFGSCRSVDPCITNPCNNLEKCIQKFQICLSSIHKPCRQYECLPLNCKPTNENQEPVCDDKNHEHQTLCDMIKVGENLGYRGPCMEGCDLHKPVCSISGETYPNECVAWAHRTIIDYLGPCIAVGLIGDDAKPRCIGKVTCPQLVSPYCTGVTPPGACCPVCGGAAKLFYSQKQVIC